MTPLLRARLLGALLLVAAFGGGMATGVFLPRRMEESTVQVKITSTDRIPGELEGLGLSDEQRARIQDILRQGTTPVRAVVQDFEPRMSAAIDSTDIEIRALLTVDQRTSLDAERKKHPLRVIKREQIDTVRR